MRNKPFMIAVGGASGSGKSFFCCRLLEIVPENIIQLCCLDRYFRDCSHLTWRERQNNNYDHPSALDADLLIRHIQDLANGTPIEAPVYDFATHCRLPDTETINPTQIVLVEGLLALHWERLLDVFDLKIFIDTPEELCLKRRIDRDTKQRDRTSESVIEQWNATVAPMYRQFCLPTRETADLVISGEEFDPELANSIIEKFGLPAKR